MEIDWNQVWPFCTLDSLFYNNDRVNEKFSHTRWVKKEEGEREKGGSEKEFTNAYQPKYLKKKLSSCLPSIKYERLKFHVWNETVNAVFAVIKLFCLPVDRYKNLSLCRLYSEKQFIRLSISLIDTHIGIKQNSKYGTVKKKKKKKSKMNALKELGDSIFGRRNSRLMIY